MQSFVVNFKTFKKSEKVLISVCIPSIKDKSNFFLF